jgi:hypothetical protein
VPMILSQIGSAIRHRELSLSNALHALIPESICHQTFYYLLRRPFSLLSHRKLVLNNTPDSGTDCSLHVTATSSFGGLTSPLKTEILRFTMVSLTSSHYSCIGNGSNKIRWFDRR